MENVNGYYGIVVKIPLKRNSHIHALAFFTKCIINFGKYKKRFTSLDEFDGRKNLKVHCKGILVVNIVVLK